MTKHLQIQVLSEERQPVGIPQCSLSLETPTVEVGRHSLKLMLASFGFLLVTQCAPVPSCVSPSGAFSPPHPLFHCEVGSKAIGASGFECSGYDLSGACRKWKVKQFSFPKSIYAPPLHTYGLVMLRLLIKPAWTSLTLNLGF